MALIKHRNLQKSKRNFSNTIQEETVDEGKDTKLNGLERASKQRQYKI